MRSAPDSRSHGWIRNLRTFSSLKNPVFRLYFIGILCQRASMNMQMVTRSLLIYRISNSAAILGIMSLANALPLLLFALLGGIIADRIQKKRVLIIGMASSAIISLGIALSLSLGYLSIARANSWWILMVASLLQGTVMGLMIPSRQAIIPEIISRGQLMNAISLDAMGMNTLRLIAPALSGFLIDAFDFEAVYYVMTGFYLTGLVFMCFLPRTSKITISKSRAFDDIKDGFRYIRHNRTILTVLGLSLFLVILSMPYMTMLPVFVDDILGVGASGMGILVSISGAGAMAGSLLLASLPNKKRGLLLLVASFFLGIALIGFSFSSIWFISIITIIFVGFGQAGRMTLSNTLVQYYVDDEYRGRVMSIYIMQFGLTSFGGFAAGLLSEGIGVQWAVGGFAMALVLVSLLALLFIPKLRRLD